MNQQQLERITLFVHYVASVVTIALVAILLPGIRVQSLLALLFVALIFGLLNALIRPVLEYFASPFSILAETTTSTLLYTLILYLTSWLADGVLVLDNILWALIGGLLTGIITTWVNEIASVMELRISRSARRRRSQRGPWEQRLKKRYPVDQDRHLPGSGASSKKGRKHE